MVASSRYWSIWCVSAASETLGYQNEVVSLAQDFFQRQFPGTIDASVQLVLLSYFKSKNTSVTEQIQFEAGLCLRCYVSAAILKACRTIDHLFGSDKLFTYRDLLPFVLNDDGKTLVILADDRGTQRQAGASAQPMRYQFFSVDVLRTFQSDSVKSSLSLDNWAILRTKQQGELKQFLAEFGVRHLSDWALLNRVRSHQLVQLSTIDRALVEVFHQVYRRDRREQSGRKRCADPSSDQLQEMITDLQASHDLVFTASELIQALKGVAVQLRQYDIWAHRLPLEVYDSETGQDRIRSDLLHYDRDESDLEQQEVLVFFEQQLNLALNVSIVQELRDRVAALERSKNYAPFASQFIPGLRLYYEQGLSLKEIAPQLGMSSWDQARRVLNPGDLIQKVRSLTVQQVLDRVLEQAQQKGFAQTPPEPDYLRTLAEQVEATADQDIFQAAVEEIRAGQHRSLNSLYAQQLRIHLNSG